MLYALIAATLAVSLAGWYAWRRSSPRDAAVYGYLLRYTAETGWVVFPARLTAAGITADRVTYPPLPLLRVGSLRVWVALVDYPALIEHLALERARESAALAELWRGGGQWVDWLRIIGAVVPAAAAIAIWSKVDALAAAVSALLAAVGGK